MHFAQPFLKVVFFEFVVKFIIIFFWNVLSYFSPDGVETMLWALEETLFVFLQDMVHVWLQVSFLVDFPNFKHSLLDHYLALLVDSNLFIILFFRFTNFISLLIWWNLINVFFILWVALSQLFKIILIFILILGSYSSLLLCPQLRSISLDKTFLFFLLPSAAPQTENLAEERLFLVILFKSNCILLSLPLLNFLV